MMRGSRVAQYLGVAACAAVAISVAGAGCERVSYYSISGGDQGGPGPAVTSSTGPGGVTGVTRAEVLAAVGTCAADLYKQAAAAAVELDAAALAANASPGAETRAAAREAWARAIGLWQQAEIYRIGPAGPVTLPGGQGLRDLVYSWPLTSRCLVEQTLVSRSYEAPTFAQTALINVRGLYAAEYLLFYEGMDNACSATSSINSSGSWAALGAAELAARKAAYAAVVSKDVAAKARQIADGWAPGQGDFGAVLASAGEGGSPFATAQMALNTVSDGLFYLEREVKDLKLGKPLGLYECTNASCPESVESQYARVARDHVKHNLIGFRRIFAGCEAGQDIGFDDLLTAMGSGALAERMTADIDAAIAAADALATPDLVAGLSTERAGVEALHASVKKITDAMKTELVTVLDLELPQVVEGDND